MSELKPCPFCCSKPEADMYPTFIKIFCAKCAKNNRNVEVFGDGPYSDWARKQKADKNGIVTISAELNPDSDIEAFNRLADKWNERAE